MNSIKELLSVADQYYRAGDIQNSARIYGQILSEDPQNAEAMLMMAVLAYKTQRYDAAENFAKNGVKLKSQLTFVGYKVLGDIYRTRELWDEAITAYKKAISLKSDFAEALNNLASIYMTQEKFDDASFFYRKVLKLNPAYSVALCNMGAISEIKGLNQEAEDYYRKSIKSNPEFSGAYYGLGSLSFKKNDYIQAREFLQTAIKLNPRHADALTLLGDIEKLEKRYSEALEFYKKAAAIAPRAEIFTIIGIVYERLEKFEQAITSYKSALSIDADYVRALRNLVRIYGYYDLHERTYELSSKGLELAPDDASFIMGMGHALRGMGRSKESVSFYKRALSLRPEDETIYPALILAMMFEGNFSAGDVAEVAFEFGDRIAAPLLRHRAFGNEKNPDRKLKIGYVSPDFRDHSVNYFFEHVLKSHNRDRFEVHAFSNVQIKDSVTERLKSEFDFWHDIKSLDDDAAADMIESAGIDILVDLAGHTADNRLLVFARKPAPVQATWLGYPATTGIKAIDYRITDIFTEPAGLNDRLNAEKLWRLPHIFCCYDARGRDVAVVDHPPSLDNGYITFGCFNNYNKVSDVALSAWGKILARVPGSRLLLEIKGLETDKFRNEVLERMLRHGIPSDRVILEPRRKENQYVLYNRIDIALDPFPGCGGTTSMDTMWMGVPMVSLAGEYFASRIGVSILNNVGLPDLVASDVDDYINKAVALASVPGRLIELRAGMRGRVEASPMMNRDLFVRDIEDAYRGMWTEWCERN